MRRVMMSLGLAVACCLASGKLCADDKTTPHGKEHAGKEHAGEHGFTKVKVEFHNKEGKPEEKDFDLTKEADLKDVTSLLKDGKIELLEAEKQPDLLAISWDLGLWTLVVFILLAVILRKAAWGPLLTGLQQREENLRSAVDEAKTARAEAQELRGHLQAERAKIAEEVKQAMDKARADGQRLVEELQSKARVDIQADRDRLRKEITAARDQALQELWSQSAQLATLVSAKAIRREISTDDHRRLVDEALAELRLAGSDWQKGTASVRL